MVKAILWMGMLGLVACFDPTTPAECAGRICAEPSEHSGHQVAGSGAAGGATGSGGHDAAGGRGGDAGHAGGAAQGGNAGWTIQIVVPTDGASFGHGELLWFEATVSAPGDLPPAEAIRWQSSQYPGELFGTGYAFQEHLGVIGQHAITAAVFQGDNILATDSVMVTAQ